MLGDRYVSLQLGGEDQMLKPGDEIEFVESAVILERLIGKLIHNTDVGNGERAESESSPMPASPRLAVGALAAAVLLAACAGTQPPRPDDDPWRASTGRCSGSTTRLDIYVLEPVASGWDYVVPDRVQRGLDNFFDNLRFPIVFVNDILQGKPRSAAETSRAFRSNTVPRAVSASSTSPATARHPARRSRTPA